MSDVATTTETPKEKPVKKTVKRPAKKAVAKKSAKSTKKAVAKKSAKKANGNGKPRENKTQKVVALMRRAKGVTREEVLKVTGWKAVSMQQLAQNTGVKLTMSKERPYHYMAK